MGKSIGALSLVIAAIHFSPTNAQQSGDDWQKILDFKLPSWVTQPNPLAESRYRNSVSGPQGRKTEIHEYLPKGQNDSTWRKKWLFVIFENAPKTVSKTFSSLLRRLGKDCIGTSQYVDYKRPRGATLYVVFCGKSKRDGMGYVSIIWMGKNGSDMIRVSEEWRGKPYDGNDSSTYFWKKADLRRAVQLVGYTHFP